MITEDYVSFETAKLLKEKGFDELCQGFYSEFFDNWQTLRFWSRFKPKSYHTVVNSGYVLVPTLQLAMKWLREKHSIFLSIQQHLDMSYVWYIYANGIPRGCDRESHNNSYEQACEAAIKYCLEHLI